ncbi:MAG: endonuclease/exonuclease/phosphatase family protein [Pseudonocardia sp.]|nr:endonuclease/exonuclease/phosphatase family protein [Pseudonocardia sp.]
MLRRPPPGPARLGMAAVLVALPWSWFLLRDPLGLVGDVLAVVLPVVVLVAVAAGILAAARWRRLWLVPAIVSALAAGIVAVVAPWTPQDAGSVTPADAMTVAAANVTGRPGAVRGLLAARPDVLAVSENNRDVDDLVRAAYPYRIFDESLTTTVSVYSRFPLRLLEGYGRDLRGVRVAVDAPTPFVLYAQHVPRPWFRSRGYQVTPAEHHRLVRELAGRVAAEPGPVVVAGDLNSADRGRDYRTLLADGGLVDAMRDGWTGPTSVTKWRPLFLRIDHVLVRRGWCGDAARHVELPGSDHDAVAAAVGPCR